MMQELFFELMVKAIRLVFYGLALFGLVMFLAILFM